MSTLVESIRDLNPCSEAIEWLDAYSDPQKAWDECPRGDWMLWLIGRHSGMPESEARKKLVLTSCKCARLALPYTKEPEALTCIETAEKWALGQASIQDLKSARAKCYTAAYAASAADAYAASAAAAAAAASAAAAAAADAAAYAASAAAAAAADAAASAAAAAAAYDADTYTISTTLKKCADIVRADYPSPPTGGLK